MEIIKLNAGNDTNGNPRRCYVRIKNGDMTHVWLDDYSGSGAVPKRYRRRAILAPVFLITPGEYRELKGRAGK